MQLTIKSVSLTPDTFNIKPEYNRALYIPKVEIGKIKEYINISFFIPYFSLFNFFLIRNNIINVTNFSRHVMINLDN